MVSQRLRWAGRARAGMAAAGLMLLLVLAAARPAAAQSACDTIGFPTGTEWSLCWELRAREGLVIRTADYKDKGGVARRVLFRGSIAEVHVPYHAGEPRFLDVTLSTSGLGAHALDLDPAECDGVLVHAKVCREVHERGHAWKFARFFQLGQEVTYWISSQLGQYTYITSWTFRDDGSIRPELVFTGRLQIYGEGPAYARFGSRVNAQAEAVPVFGLNHMHNVYWRLDLDIAGAGNDAVDRIVQRRHTGPSPEPGVSCAIPGTCHVNLHTRLKTERVERLGRFRSWHLIDRGVTNAEGRAIGYEIIPEGNQLWTGPRSEPWAAGELYVTRHDPCELFAVNNHRPLNPGCGGSAPHVRAMVNGQGIDGADLVLWYVAHFQHVTRDEDELNMPAEHVALEIHPRSWRHVNTLQ